MRGSNGKASVVAVFAGGCAWAHRGLRLAYSGGHETEPAMEETAMVMSYLTLTGSGTIFGAWLVSQAQGTNAHSLTPVRGYVASVRWAQCKRVPGQQLEKPRRGRLANGPAGNETRATEAYSIAPTPATSRSNLCSRETPKQLSCSARSEKAFSLTSQANLPASLVQRGGRVLLSS